MKMTGDTSTFTPLFTTPIKLKSLSLSPTVALIWLCPAVRHRVWKAPSNRQETNMSNISIDTMKDTDLPTTATELNCIEKLRNSCGLTIRRTDQVADLSGEFVERERKERLVTTKVVEATVAAWNKFNSKSGSQAALMTDPEAGPVVPGSGVVRKLRWAAPGRSKRGGYRVIYYVRHAHGVIWMLTMYPKNVSDNIPAHVLRKIRK